MIKKFVANDQVYHFILFVIIITANLNFVHIPANKLFLLNEDLIKMYKEGISLFFKLLLG